MSGPVDKNLVDSAFETYLDWRMGCAGVEAAYEDWLQAPREKAAVAFQRYRAALNEEERLSHEYAVLVEGVAA